MVRSDRTFVIVAVVALVLSLAAPLSVSDEGDAAAVGTLMLMHVLTAAIVVAGVHPPLNGRTSGLVRA